MYDSNTTLYLARMRLDEAAARHERERLVAELRASRSTEDTSPRPRRHWSWSIRPWSVRPLA